MALDIHITIKTRDIIHVAMSEDLHSKIFSNLVRWSSFKNLRKIKDYYRADHTFTGTDAAIFVDELLQALSTLNVEQCKLYNIFNSIKEKEILTIRISSD